MCKECAQYGDKYKWYLNQKNYILEQIVSSKELTKRLNFLEGFQSNRKKFYMDVLEESILYVLFNSDIFCFDNFNFSNIKGNIKEIFLKKFEYYHSAQVIPIEDALKVIELPEKIYLFNCVCKQIYDGEDRASCLCFNTLGDIMYQYPDYHVNKFKNNIISKDEAKELLIRENNDGAIHCLYYYIKPYIGALCSCKLPFCPNLKNYLWQNEEAYLKKSEYLVSIKTSICNYCEGMGCIKRCNFGALSKADNKMFSLDTDKCFGCGQCKNGCKLNAIELVDRGV